MCSEWRKTIFVQFALAFADDSILPLIDPLGSGNANFSLVGQKYFNIDIVPKTTNTCLHNIFTLIVILVKNFMGYLAE